MRSMRIFIYGTLILIAMAALAGPEKVHHEIDLLMQDENALKLQADIDMQEWDDGLNEYLLNHSSPNVRIFAIRTLFLPRNVSKTELTKQDQHKIDELNAFIYNIITHESVGPQALIILSAYCDNEKKLFQCDNERLIEKLIELEPNNIASYVSLLDQEIELQDPNEIKQAFSKMAKSNYHNNYFNIFPELEQSVFEYAEKNPLPQSYINRSDQIFGFKDSKQHYSQQELEDNLLYSQLIGMKMAIPMPSYRVFTATCKETPDLKDECLKIADTLINHSFTLIAKKIGYAIKKEIYKTSGNDSLYLSVKESDNKLSKEYTCLSNSLFSIPDSGFHITAEKYQSSNKVEIEKGEYYSFKILAELHYQENIEKGNHDAINPESCYQ